MGLQFRSTKKMKKTNTMKVDQVNINKDTGEVYLKLENDKKEKMVLFFPRLDGTEVKENDIINFHAISFTKVISTNVKDKRIITDPKYKTAINFIGRIIETRGSDQFIDAGLCIKVHDTKFKIGDYVTGEFPSYIQGYILKKNEK